MKLSRETTTHRIVDVINGKIDVFDNIYCKIVDVADTGAANTEFTVTHNLGRTPVAYIANIDKSGNIYDSNRASWTDTTLKLKCSAANAVLKLIVL